MMRCSFHNQDEVALNQIRSDAHYKHGRYSAARTYSARLSSKHDMNNGTKI